ncbi:MAG: hypothetical protein H6600_10225 [Flavobacteriales bacterium]|nr:hypothetical protein [Flavobacteriales bacterium]MCB9195772.1 hypothetical protein [Flavobacteriales bacterium]MCB9198826.1 hypothetical protein [Flavobacteriales bacterium]
MKKALLFLVFSIGILINGNTQELSSAGMFSLGSRSTISLFNHYGSGVGTGAGGQFRIQLSNRVNTEWYLDYISSDAEGIVGRKDLHIGWSVFYYYLKNNSTSEKLLQPFFEVGHCFDHTFVNEIGTDNFLERWSSAVQFGTGISFNLTPRLDFSSKVQYMIHLGSDIAAEIDDDGHDHHHVTLSKNSGVDLEGHILVTLSMNYKIGKLWGRN